MFKLIVPLVFVLLADGKLAGGNPPPGKADTGGRPIATERVADGHKAPHAGAGDKAAGAGWSAPGAKKLTLAGPGSESGEGERALTPPPGISASAWREELGVRAGNQKAVTERERLEALSADLAKTRTALREETTRLEGLMEKTRGARTGAASVAGSPTIGPEGSQGAGQAAGGQGAGAPPGGGSGMGIGDPLVPNAYYRPAPPPPNFAVQVEVVSKAMKNMKPEQAAGILAHLERGLAAEVLQRMRPADAGAILGFLKPEVGALLAAEIVSRPPVGARSKDSDKEKP